MVDVCDSEEGIEEGLEEEVVTPPPLLNVGCGEYPPLVFGNSDLLLLLVVCAPSMLEGAK